MRFCTLNKFSRYLFLFLITLIHCKEGPSFSAVNRLDPESTDYVPDTPSNFHATVADPSHITLQWTHPSYDTKSDFILERRINNEPFEQLVTTGDSTQYLDSLKLIPGHTYQYRIKAATRFQESDYVSSNELIFTLNRVEELQLLGIEADSVRVSWENSNSYETEYRIGIHREHASDTLYQILGESVRSYIVTGLDTLEDYTISVSPLLHGEYLTEFPTNRVIRYKRELFETREYFRLSDRCCNASRAAYIANGNRIVIGTQDGQLRIFDAQSGSEIRTVNTNSNFIYYLKGFDSGRFFVTVSTDDITIRDQSGSLVEVIDEDGGDMSSTVLDHGDSQILAYSRYGSTRMYFYDLKNRSTVYDRQTTSSDLKLAFSETGAYLLIAKSYDIEIRSFPDYELLGTFYLDPETSRDIDYVTFLNQSDRFYYAANGGGEPNIIREMYFDPESGITAGDIYGAVNFMYGIRSEPTGRYVVVNYGSTSANLRFFDNQRKEFAFTLHDGNGPTYDVDFHPVKKETLLRVGSQTVSEFTYRKNWF